MHRRGIDEHFGADRLPVPRAADVDGTNVERRTALPNVTAGPGDGNDPIARVHVHIRLAWSLKCAGCENAGSLLEPGG